MACSGSQAWTCHELAYPCLSRAIEATKPFFVYTVAFMIAVALHEILKWITPIPVHKHTQAPKKALWLSTHSNILSMHVLEAFGTH